MQKLTQSNLFNQQSLVYLQAMGIDYWHRRVPGDSQMNNSNCPLATVKQVGIVDKNQWLFAAIPQTPAEQRLLKAIALALGIRGDELSQHLLSLKDDSTQQHQQLEEVHFIFLFGEEAGKNLAIQVGEQVSLIVLPSLNALLSNPMLKKALWQRIAISINNQVNHGTE